MILVTGCAGFIGFHLCNYLLKNNFTVIGIDNLNNYYSPKLKQDRLKHLLDNKNFTFYQLDINDRASINKINNISSIEIIVSMAAQAGVRYSLQDPFAYTKSNVNGHLSILEFAKDLPNLKKIVYASSSSVYGNNKKIPFSPEDPTDNPISVYAATKKACELLSQTYYNLYNIPMIGLRFFTVYGPWGRPDMSPYKFSEAIFTDKSIELYNFGKMQRDFTYIDDIIDGIVAAISLKHTDHRIYNLGNNKPIELMYFVNLLEKNIGRPAKINLLPMQKGEVLTTYADIDKSITDLNFIPKTSIEEGITRFIKWFKEYNDISI